MVFARLVAHWPYLGGSEDDPLARARAEDWVTSLRRLPAVTGNAAVSLVIESHRERRAPVFADVQQAARQIGSQPREHVRELESGSLVARGDVGVLIAQARAALADAAQVTPVEGAAWKPVSRHDKSRPRVFWGERRMTVEERDAELQRFGSRRVRDRRP